MIRRSLLDGPKIWTVGNNFAWDGPNMDLNLFRIGY